MIWQIKVGAIHTNCYIIYDNGEAIIIDPGYPDERIVEFIDENGLKVKFIYLTHCHFDHMLGATWLKEKYNVDITCLDKEKENLNNCDVNLSLRMTGKKVEIKADRVFSENDEIKVGNLSFRVIHTPGHTSGSSSLYGDGILISGDTLFSDCFGRCDLPTSNFSAILKSVSEKLYILPKDTIVYPGHGKSTLIKEEKPIYLELKPRQEC